MEVDEDEVEESFTREKEPEVSHKSDNDEDNGEDTQNISPESKEGEDSELKEGEEFLPKPLIKVPPETPKEKGCGPNRFIYFYCNDPMLKDWKKMPDVLI